MAEQAVVTLAIDDGLAVIRLDDPDHRNAMTQAFFQQFNDVVHRLVLRRSEVRAVLIAASGRYFSVGGDIGEFGADPQTVPDLALSGTYWMHPALARLARLDAPLIAAVQGSASGGAVAVVSNCDLVISARTATFSAAYSKIGFSPDLGATFGLASRMGLARARRFLMLAEQVDADEALRLGLVDEVVDDVDLEDVALARARTLAAGPTRAYGEIRRLVDRSLATPFETQLEDEAQALTRMTATSDAVEGLQSFLEKRKPDFRGE